jgi:Domain of unknown function (DUF4111)/Nucleotidyltransferase domain
MGFRRSEVRILSPRLETLSAPTSSGAGDGLIHHARVVPERAARELANELLAACEAAMDDGSTENRGPVVAAYLHGSLARGSYVAGRSDVDVLLVTGRPLTGREQKSLRRTLDGVAAGAPCRFDLEIVTADMASQPTRRPRVELYYGFHGATLEIVIGDIQPDLVVEFSTIRQEGEALFGPPAALLIAEPPPEWIDARGEELLDRWSRLTDDAVHAELMVLTACRIWRWADERRHTSKEEAGGWVLARNPTLTAVAAALIQRQRDPNETISAAAIADVLAAARGALEHRRQSPAAPGSRDTAEDPRRDHNATVGTGRFESSRPDQASQR